jgi:hypothetical protein
VPRRGSRRTFCVARTRGGVPSRSKSPSFSPRFRPPLRSAGAALGLLLPSRFGTPLSSRPAPNASSGQREAERPGKHPRAAVCVTLRRILRREGALAEEHPRAGRPSACVIENLSALGRSSARSASSRSAVT